MKRFFSILRNAVCVLCVGTVLAQAALLIWLASRGGLTGEKINGILVTLYEVDADALEEKLKADRQPHESEQVSYEEVARARAEKDLLLTMREQSVSNATRQLIFMQSEIEVEKVRFKEIRDGFDNELRLLQETKKSEGLEELQRTLEALAPGLAKEQILKILDIEGGTGQDGLNDIVSIVKAMPLDKRKKILGEFKSEREQDVLHLILDQLRKGEPEVSLINGTRETLGQSAG